jgi:uncharacterized protein
MKKILLAIILAIGITTAMDANGLSAFSALPLFLLMALLTWVSGYKIGELGFKKGNHEAYKYAVLYPVIVIGIICLFAFIFHATHFNKPDWGKILANLAITSFATIIMSLITEEGFFRGWLFVSFQKQGFSPGKTIFWSSIIFSAWHISAVLLPTGFDLPAREIPLFLINAALLGAIWGTLRSSSGSLLPSSLSHGLWNGLVYTFLGFGNKPGVLGINNTVLWGAETGLIGILLNSLFLFFLYRKLILRK